VRYVPGTKNAATIQVKAISESVPAGGKGEPAVGRVFHPKCPPRWLAVVDLSRDKAWLFTMEQAHELAQQKPDSGAWRIYWYLNESVVSGTPRRESDMAKFEIDDGFATDQGWRKHHVRGG